MFGHEALKDMAENPGKVYEQGLYQYRFNPRYRELQTRMVEKEDWSVCDLMEYGEILANDWEPARDTETGGN